MEKLGHIIRRKRKAMGLNQGEFGELVGYEQQTVSGWERGVVSQIRHWERLADVLEIPHDEMLAMMAAEGFESDKTKRLMPALRLKMGTGQYQIGGGDLRATNGIIAKPMPDMNERNVPVLGRAQGGGEGEYEFNGDVVGWLARPPQLQGIKEAYGLYVDGDSMFPRYKPGESVWVNPNRPPARGDDVIVQLHPDREHDNPRGFIKEFVGWSGKHLNVRQHNPQSDIQYDRNEVLSVHTIVLSQKSSL